MIGLQAYRTHLAMNLHFVTDSKYDYFKYNGKSRVSEQSFLKSQFKWQYAAVENKSKDMLFHFYLLFKENEFRYVKQSMGAFKTLRRVSNDFSINRDSYIKDIIKNDCGYLKSKHRDDLGSIVEVNGLYPTLYQYYVGYKISIESLILFDSYVTSILKLENSVDPISWPSALDHINLIRPFVTQMIDRNDYVRFFNFSMT